MITQMILMRNIIKSHENQIIILESLGIILFVRSVLNDDNKYHA